MKLLVTGGCGFIGSHFVEHSLTRYPDLELVNVDALTYAAHPETCSHLSRLAPNRYHFVRLDIASEELAEVIRKHSVDAVVNFAAETHVDRSILEPAAFMRTNVLGLENILRQARRHGDLRVIHISTDEVYGSLGPSDAQFTEHSPLSPNSPYAASKAAADLVALASFRTYGQPVVITRCSNNFGPFQFPEKLIPLLIANALEDKPVPVYGDGKQVRDWIYVRDHCCAIDLVLKKGRPGEIYNISASQERPNLEVIRKVLGLLNKPESLMQHVGDRPAHDRRYGLKSEKIQKELGWNPDHTFEQALELTVQWYLDNRAWWKKVRDEKYYQYYEANYLKKFKEGAKGP